MSLLQRPPLAHGGAGGLDELLIVVVPAIAFVAFVVVSHLRARFHNPEREADGVRAENTSETDGR